MTCPKLKYILTLSLTHISEQFTPVSFFTSFLGVLSTWQMPQAPEAQGLSTLWLTKQISKNRDWDPHDEEPLVLSCSKKEGGYSTWMWRGESYRRKLQRGSVCVESAHKAWDLFPLLLVDSPLKTFNHSKQKLWNPLLFTFPPQPPPLLFFCVLCAQPHFCLSHMLQYINAD